MEDRVRRARTEKRKWLEQSYSKVTKPSDARNWVGERVERDLIRWESAFRRGKDAAIGPYAVEGKAVGLGEGRLLSYEERQSLESQGLKVPATTTKRELPALARALESKRQTTAQTKQEQIDWTAYKIGKADELSTKRLFIADALRQQSKDIDWQRGEDKRALDNQAQLMKMEKAQLELMELRKPIHMRADNLYKLMMKEIDISADIDKEEAAQLGRIELAEIKEEEKRITKMTAPPREDSIIRFNQALPQMQTVGDILRYYVGEKYKTEDAWTMTRLAAERLGVKTEVNFDSSDEDKLKFYRMPLLVPQALDTRTRSFNKYNSYDQVVQDLSEWGLDPMTNPEAADILQQAQQYFQNVRGSAESMLGQGMGGSY